MEPGKLYVVATPIGNREDITLRALSVLRQADLIAAEDTRETAKFLGFHGIKNRMLSFHEHNESRRIPEILDKILQGACVALVSEAGTPSVSDPGYRLVREAVARSIPVVPIPGPSAAVAALSVSGLATDAFVFIGFLPRKKGKRTDLLERLACEDKTLIFYESPRRVLELLSEAAKVLGDREAVLCREMTKVYEEFIRGSLSQIRARIAQYPEIRGECTLVVAGAHEREARPETIEKEIETLLKEGQTGTAELSKALAGKYGVSRQRIYEEIVRIKKQIPCDDARSTKNRKSKI